MKEVQATGEIFIPQKLTSSIPNLKLLRIIFAPPDPDPADQNECGSVRIRIHNTEKTT